jgi:ribosomal protein L37E
VAISFLNGTAGLLLALNRSERSNSDRNRKELEMGKRTFCHRCGDRCYEILETHSHCPACLYSPDLDERFEPSIPTWARKFMPKESDVSLEAAIKEAELQVALEAPIEMPLSENPLLEE